MRITNQTKTETTRCKLSGAADAVIDGPVANGACVLEEDNPSRFKTQVDHFHECWPWDAPSCRMLNLECWDNDGGFRSDSTGFFE